MNRAFSPLANICRVSGSLTDAHILDLSKRITGESELMDLGIKVLKQPDFVIKTALFNKKEIQDATYEVLSTWEKGQNSRREAYINLHTGLRENGMKQLAAELKRWVEGTSAETAGISTLISGASDESKFQSK